MRLKRFLFIVCLLFQHVAQAYAPTNFFRPYDINLRTAEWKGTDFKVGANFEYGETSKCRDYDENKNGVLRRYNESESTLAMLMGANRGTEIYNLANQLLSPFVPATDDGVRGHFNLDGKFEEWDLTLWGKYDLPIEVLSGNWSISAYLPIKSLKVENVKWNDQTENVLQADRMVRELLTDDIHTVAKELGGLDLKAWDKVGLSDFVLMLGWYKDFRQMKEHLKNVRLSAKLGLSIPTGAEKDEDKSLSLPMGNDGAWGVPLGAGIDLDFVNKIKAGLEFEMLFLMDETRERRLMTDINQTDYLFLHKGRATKSFGVAYKFNLFLQLKHILGGLSTMAAYQFMKHDDDRLTAQSNDFSYYIINSAQSLKEWNMQNFVFKLDYDFFNECKNSWFKPQISFFYKLPVTGKRVINPHTFGGQISFSF